jgi:hypothetical protein
MSLYRAAIRNWPHTPTALKALDQLRVKGIHTRMRARGSRAGGGTPHGFHQRPWDQDLPRERATHYTIYQVTPDDHTSYGYQRADYVGIDPNGKVRLRCTATTEVPQ